ncbi:uncharacterized protein [Nicotiana tomentosiformis]|uniref:uncharacterized protein n=1 Tax=Nicotiana tomentosiformis TaxID=4098 RepID=UPI00051B36D3|nr:uncharacterized protein LOC104119887 isoform X2 [Nicotiana tomentosiformis]
MRKQDTEGLNLAENAIVVVPEQATSSLYKAGFPKQTALTIRESYALLEKAASHQLCATTSRDNYKNIPCFNYHYLAFPELELRVSVPKAGSMKLFMLLDVWL